MNKIEQDLQEWVKSHKITEVEALVPDMTGNARGKIIPAYRFFEGDGTRLPEAILVQTVTGDWPDDEVLEEIVSPADIDLYLQPDAETARLVPWVEDPTAQIIHDCVTSEGEPHPLASRNVLKSVLALFEKEGLEPVVAPELEFYLVKKNTNSDNPLEPPIGRSGRPERARQSYSIDAANEFDPLFEEMYHFCEAMKLDVDTLIHEEGAAQMEINFNHGNALELADQIFLFKRMMREVALRHDVYATFLAKPMENEPGSSMHIHQSMNEIARGSNIFAKTDDNKFPDTMMHYIAGLQKYVPASMAFFAPNVNSYRRIALDDGSPINVHWGIDNRTAGLRIPVSSAKASRVESRFAGSDVNPYLAIAATLACGHLGMKEKLQPTKAIEGSAQDEPVSLPSSLETSLLLLEQEPKLIALLGENFVKAYVGVKRKEYETYLRVISSWEREYLLLSV
jgi:glutamine synthetase